MFDHNHYVPCLRWKQGEYQALQQLSPKAKAKLTPLVEVAEMNFDFETRKAPKSVDEHLEDVADRFEKKWGAKRIFVDLKHLSAFDRMKDGTHPLTFVFTGLRAKGVPAIPVSCLVRHTDYQNAVRRVIGLDRRGVCLRLTLLQIHDRDFLGHLEKLLQYFGVSKAEVDLILDLEAPSFDPLSGFVGMVKSTIARIPRLDAWRTFTLLGTSFPKSMGTMNRGTQSVQRKEWLCYKELLKQIGRGERKPAFGDYVVAHPEVAQQDHRKVKPSATIRYATKDAWIVVKGRNVRDYGYGQYRGICAELISNPAFSGRGFSAADKFIAECAEGSGKTGNLSTWRQIGTNHHLERVVSDLSSLGAS